MDNKNSYELPTMFGRISGELCTILKDRFKAQITGYKATWVEFKVNGKILKVEIKEVENEIR